MIPKKMNEFLKSRLPEQTWTNRLIREDGRCYMEFFPVDVDRLARLGIEGDSLGPEMVVCMWDEESPLEVGGYLVIDNLAMGRPAVGGLRMLPDITPEMVSSRARGMTLKNAASALPFGGGKVGIIAERSLTPQEHTEVVRRFAKLLYRYRAIFMPGPDVGTIDVDMRVIAIENGLDTAISKPAEMGGSSVDQLGAAAGGLVIALKALLNEMPRLKSLSQFVNLEIPSFENLTVIIQGFGSVGSNLAYMIDKQIPGAKVIGISDALGYLYDTQGLPISDLVRLREERISVTRPYFTETLVSDRWGVSRIKYCSSSNDLLRESAFCMIPASPVSNYLDLDENSQPSITVARMGDWKLIIEGANTYSPNRFRKANRLRMEREVYRQKGVLIATDFLVNSGGVIFAAQEIMIKTPADLRIPDSILGDEKAVDRWIREHSDALKELAEIRRKAAEKAREEVIVRNMREFVDQLVLDPDLLPCEAAEQIAIHRAIRKESDRTAMEIMSPAYIISENRTIRDAAKMLVDTGSSILAVVSEEETLVGVVTDWDITNSTARGISKKQALSEIMERDVVFVDPKDKIINIIRKLEHEEITAVPVVENGKVLGVVSSDLLTRRTLLRLLQSPIQ